MSKFIILLSLVLSFNVLADTEVIAIEENATSPAVEQPVTAEEAVVTEEPVVEEEAVIAEEDVIAEEPVVEEEAVIAEEPVVEDAPVVIEETATIEEPVPAEKPVTIEQSITAEEPVITEKQNPIEKEYSMVIIKTNKGDIKVKLFDKEAPESVENFLQYAKDGHYDGTIFHRVIDGFMIQGGGFTPDMQQKSTRAPIKNEANNGLKNTRGTLAMARTQVIDSATSQFFINVKDNDFLNFRDPSVQGYGYCVFGEVVDGMDVVDAIKSVKTGRSGHFQDVPQETIEILEIAPVEE